MNVNRAVEVDGNKRCKRLKVCVVRFFVLLMLVCSDVTDSFVSFVVDTVEVRVHGLS